MLKRRRTKQRLERLASRSVWDSNAVADSIVGTVQSVDQASVKRQLTALAAAISVPVGLLRPDDVVEDLIGKDYFAGDAVLDIERQLQHTDAANVTRLTVRQVVLALASTSGELPPF